MQTLIIKREQGGLAKQLPGGDHISGLLYVVESDADIPAAFTDRRYQPCSSTKAMAQLGLVPTAGLGYHVAEAMRLCPGISLWVGYAFASDTTMKAVGELQRAAGGNIRQMGIAMPTIDISRSIVAALQAQAAALDNDWMPLSIVVAPRVDDHTTLPDDMAGSAPNVSVLVGKDWAADESAIGTLIGTLASRAVHESIAWVERCDTGLGIASLADGIPYVDVDAARLELIDRARLIYLRTYPGIAGVFFSDSHTMDAPTGDYCQIELQRTMDKAVRLVRTNLLPELGRPIRFNADGTLRADTLQHLRTVASRATDQMERDGEVSGWQVLIDPAQDVLGTNRVEFSIKAVPVGIMRRAEVSIGFTQKIDD